MSQRVDNEPAYVLHTHPWKETSLIVEAFTAGHGRIGLVARGARRAHAALRTRLLAFQPLGLSWYGKGGLKTLHAAEWLGGALQLAGRALICGFYVNELILKLLPPEDPHEALYRRYEATLHALASAQDPQPVLRRFELDLLSALGYAQTLDRTVGGETVHPDRRYGYVFGQGVVEAAQTALNCSGKALLDMAAGDYSDPRTLAESKQFMRALINHYLSDKPLHTRQLLLDLQAL
jgi:DNA repair protein RecO (recombination protein O)